MYNEEAGAEKCVREVCSALSKISNPAALIVVNDGSRDATGSILRASQGQWTQFVLVDEAQNKGYGAAIRTGVHKAGEMGFEYVLFMDSDLTNHPSDIIRFAEKMKLNFDVIKASRYVSEGRMQGVPWQRAVISRIGNLVARALFGVGIRDCTNGFRAVKLSLLKQMRLRENDFSIIVEELFYCKILAQTFCEVPVVLTNRAGSQRPTSFAYRPRVFAKYLKFGLKAFFHGRTPLNQETRKYET
jgi:dolichol-phosphate mannosyltransferase